MQVLYVYLTGQNYIILVSMRPPAKEKVKTILIKDNELQENSVLVKKKTCSKIRQRSYYINTVYINIGNKNFHVVF